MSSCLQRGYDLVAGSGAVYTYSGGAVPLSVIGENDPLRTILHSGSKISFVYGGLLPKADYSFRIHMLSDQSGRIQRVLIDGAVTKDNIVLPDDKPLVVELDVSKDAQKDGVIQLDIEKITGPNAVVSRVELLSDQKGDFEVC